MPVDLSVFDQQSLQDAFDAHKALQLQNQLATAKLLQSAPGGDLPASIQVANAIQQARAAGDTQRINDLTLTSKLFDRGIGVGPDGTPIAIAGYAPALAGIQGAVAGAKEGAQQQQQLQYAGPIQTAKTTAETNAKQVGNLQEKADSVNSTTSLTADARNLLKSNHVTGSYAGAGLNFGKRVFGVSDDTTQTNTKLKNIATSLTSAVPRFQGPQSDKDVAFYKELAGNVGDPTIPVGDRLAALDQIDDINKKFYAVKTPTKEILQAANPGMSLPGAKPIPGLGGVTGADVNAGVVPVTSEAEILALPPGTKFSFNGRTGTTH